MNGKYGEDEEFDLEPDPIEPTTEGPPDDHEQDA